MTELELIIDLHRNAERQGPGSDKDTLRALEAVRLPRDRNWKVADIGCGTGSQTIALARQIRGTITAVDLFPEFLAVLEDRAEHAGLGDRITTLPCSMDDLPFADDELDLIWAEGSIYNMGFAKGVRQWKRFLRTGGYLAVSEITWLTRDRPAEIASFWGQEYPEIDTAAAKVKVLEDEGFILEGYFNLSEDSWMATYYAPLAERFPAFLERHNNADPARKVVEQHAAEIQLYRTFKDRYSYGFYVARKC